MATEHVKTWEGAGRMLSFRAIMAVMTTIMPRHTRLATDDLIYRLNRLNHDRRRYIAWTLVIVTAVPTAAESAPGLSAPYGEDVCTVSLMVSSRCHHPPT